MPADFRHIDPGELHIPPSRSMGADSAKFRRQTAQFGAQVIEMPPLWVYEAADGVLVIYDGITRATRAARWAPGTPICVEVIGKLR